MNKDSHEHDEDFLEAYKTGVIPEFEGKGRYITWSSSWNRTGFSDTPEYPGQHPCRYPPYWTNFQCSLMSDRDQILYRKSLSRKYTISGIGRVDCIAKNPTGNWSIYHIVKDNKGNLTIEDRVTFETADAFRVWEVENPGNSDPWKLVMKEDMKEIRP